MVSKNLDNSKKKHGKTFKIALIALSLIVIIVAVLFWRAGSIFNKVSTGGNIFSNIVNVIPGVKEQLEGEEEGRINVLILGMRGENIPGGGLLSDTIMIASIAPKQNEIALMSIPRDFYVHNPALNSKSKINAVYAYGENEENERMGLEYMKQAVSDIVGQDIHYGGAINFNGFKEIINSLGGVDINLDEPFVEPVQFNEEHVCDENVFTIPTGEYQEKIDYRGKVVARYPLCTNPDTECGGVFRVPAGQQTLNGEEALCYVRARATSSDFDRARRQQQVLQDLKNKALKVGTLTDFSKINSLFDSLGNNARTDMQLWEMKRLFEIYSDMENPKVSQKVLENSEEGLLYAPESDKTVGYILLPRGDNYDRIRNLFDSMISQPTTDQQQQN